MLSSARMPVHWQRRGGQEGVPPSGALCTLAQVGKPALSCRKARLDVVSVVFWLSIVRTCGSTQPCGSCCDQQPPAALFDPALIPLCHSAENIKR